MTPSTDDPLDKSVQFVRGVGPDRAELFAKLEIRTVRDLLWFLPRDVLDLSELTPIFELNEDRVHVVRGQVVDKDARLTSKGKTMTAVLLKGDSGFIRGVWFEQPWMLRKFDQGQTVLFTGKPKFRDRRWEFSHPQVQWLEEDDQGATPGVLPRYPLTEGLRMADARRATAAAVEDFAEYVVDPLPEELRSQWNVISLANAVRQLHRPPTMDAYAAARRRILFDDLLEFEIGLALRRRAWNKENRAVALPCTAKIDARIRRLFPFQFTAGQNTAVAEIVTDLARDQAMHRLLQADVGAGKTAVAVYAMLVAIANGRQAALLAPTEVLAQQHWQTVERLLEQSRVQRRLLTGQLTTGQRQTVRQEIAKGTAELIVGTQALIQEGVEFAKLGLVVIDEQHKFGVGQRGKFQSTGESPHRLVMTATPIPRSLCLTLFGDLDLTSIRELPPGRQRVVTSLLRGPGAVTKAWEFLCRKLAEGRQAYVVCPRIDDDAEDSLGAEAVFRSLSTGLLSSFRVGLLHGRLDRDVRNQTMDAFRRGEVDVLVATTVIEVGVDVPNATLMLIQAAERFGLSQLHQLRGRIGRGMYQGYCFLQSETDAPDSLRRLAAMEATADGFQLAEIDFQLRGPGDVLGTRQHGALPLRVANVARDQELLEETRGIAQSLVETGTIDAAELRPLKVQVLERFQVMMDLPQSG